MNEIDWNEWRIVEGGYPHHFRVQKKFRLLGLWFVGWSTIKDLFVYPNGEASEYPMEFKSYEEAEEYIKNEHKINNFKVCKRT